MPRTSRSVADLPEQLRYRLSSYALVAGAAGVSMLALAPTAEAKIIYRPTHRHISLGHPAVITLDHGVGTFKLSVNKTTYGGISSVPLGADGRSFRKSVGGFTSSHGSGIAYAFKAGSVIGPKRLFNGNVINGWTGMSGGFCFSEQPYGWRVNEKAYLGLRLPPVNGDYHYGWARLNTHCKDGNVTALLTGYAYETVPNKPIIAGKTKGPDVITDYAGSLGHLARGVSGRTKISGNQE